MRIVLRFCTETTSVVASNSRAEAFCCRSFMFLCAHDLCNSLFSLPSEFGLFETIWGPPINFVTQEALRQESFYICSQSSHCRYEAKDSFWVFGVAVIYIQAKSKIIQFKITYYSLHLTFKKLLYFLYFF